MKATKARCGTPSGHSTHLRRDEKPCDACARARADYDRRRRAAPERTQKARLRAIAQSRALLALSRRYPTEYRTLYEAEKTRLAEEVDR